jgi:ribonuclease E
VRTRTPVALYILNQKRANLRDLERRFGVAIVVEADDTLTGANYHALERGELATGVKIDSEPLGPPQEDTTTIVEEQAPVEEDEEQLLEAPSQDGDEVSEISERGGALSPEEGDVGRRRRRRRRRRGGDRPFGENPPQDAPQPRDDGLAVVAEIGGDLELPSSAPDTFDRRGPRSEEERIRRSRRSRGARNRFSQRADDENVSEGIATSETETAPAELAAESEPDFPQMSPLAAEADLTLDKTIVPASSAAELPVTPEASTTPPNSASNPDATVGPAQPAAPPQPSAEPAPAAVDGPARPRRSGWWQRARASVMGD